MGFTTWASQPELQTWHNYNFVVWWRTSLCLTQCIYSGSKQGRPVRLGGKMPEKDEGQETFQKKWGGSGAHSGEGLCLVEERNCSLKNMLYDCY